MNAAGAVLDDDQRAETTEQHRGHMDEVDSENAAGLGCQELPLSPAAAAGCGPIPASCRICWTVDAAIQWPSLMSSPGTRRCPQVGLSVAMRITSVRIVAAVDGRPGRRRLA